MSEPEAKVKQVHNAPLRWQQLTQLLLGLDFRGGDKVEKLELKSNHHGHNGLIMSMEVCENNQVVFVMQQSFALVTCM